jgi:peptidoglycan-associated lipoprotein
MQKNRLPLLLLFIIIILPYFLLACAGKDVPPAAQETQAAAISVPPPPPPPPPTEDKTPIPAESRLPEGWESFVNEDIYFNKNSAALLPEAKEVLSRKAAWLYAHPDIRIVIQGHSDEKGSAEFNLALADHRAGNVKSYLLGQGIPTERLVVVSYGSESPATVSRGEFDSAKNRRVHFSIDVID